MMNKQTNRIIVKPDNVAFVACIEKDWCSITIPVIIKDQIPLVKCVLNSEAKVIKLKTNIIQNCQFFTLLNTTNQINTMLSGGNFKKLEMYPKTTF